MNAIKHSTPLLFVAALFSVLALTASTANAAIYSYVATNGQVMTIEADTASLAIATAPGIDPRSGVIEGDLTQMMSGSMMDEESMDVMEEIEEMVEDLMMNDMPVVADGFDGSSAVYFSDDADRVFFSSNTGGEVAFYDTEGSGEMMMADVMADDADGIYFDADTSMLYQVNRTDNRIDVYEWNEDTMELEYAMSSEEDEFMNGRELAVMGDMLVVADDASEANGDQNSLVVFEMEGDELMHVATYMVDINLWGIFANGDDLHAIVDNSNELAIFEDFFMMDAAMMDMSEVEADMMIEVEGIVRTHGLDYNMDEDIMVLTDVGDAGSDSDGAIVVVYDFTSAISDGMIDLSEQMRIAGPDTMLGNPVDVALDYDNEMIYVAERANLGGQVLGFMFNE